jgi:hypothetical protein
MPFYGQKNEHNYFLGAFFNSFRLFLPSVILFELDISELHTPVMKQLPKL